MKILKSDYEIKAYVNKHSFEGYQVLYKVWKIFNVKIWFSEVDREDVPGWAYIQYGALGYTDWKSKFQEYFK